MLKSLIGLLITYKRLQAPSDPIPGNPAGKAGNLIISRQSWWETRESYNFSVILAGNPGIP